MARACIIFLKVKPQIGEFMKKKASLGEENVAVELDGEVATDSVEKNEAKKGVKAVGHKHQGKMLYVGEVTHVMPSSREVVSED